MPSSASGARPRQHRPRDRARNIALGVARDLVRDWRRWSPMERIIAAACLIIPVLASTIIASIHAFR